MNAENQNTLRRIIRDIEIFSIDTMNLAVETMDRANYSLPIVKVLQTIRSNNNLLIDEEVIAKLTKIREATIEHLQVCLEEDTKEQSQTGEAECEKWRNMLASAQIIALHPITKVRNILVSYLEAESQCVSRDNRDKYETLKSALVYDDWERILQWET
jgi:hypothetical protein